MRFFGSVRRTECRTSDRVYMFCCCCRWFECESVNVRWMCCLCESECSLLVMCATQNAAAGETRDSRALALLGQKHFWKTGSSSHAQLGEYTERDTHNAPVFIAKRLLPPPPLPPRNWRNLSSTKRIGERSLCLFLRCCHTAQTKTNDSRGVRSSESRRSVQDYTIHMLFF